MFRIGIAQTYTQTTALWDDDDGKVATNKPNKKCNFIHYHLNAG
jgi:hypothetical protein